ncbi:MULTISPECIES: hypothetical protein [unclassified Flammeovirga]|uniref:hypothetical protein n=1 Tax=unclassified Flammeovirga TaxID=2637820 RepID=UPI0005C58B6C|nr:MULTISPECIES: hypothetical protein [unclassified Flammeovirga]MBD0404955.1 hypothetical protein [Flammeovirga sp. EKP202]
MEHLELTNATQSSDLVKGYPVDTPDQHGFVILGEDTLFLSHFMMFAMPNHQYQVILEIEMPENDRQLYVNDLKEYPNRTHTLANIQEIFPMILPDIGKGGNPAFDNYPYVIHSFPFEMYRGVPIIPEEHAVLLAKSTLTIKKVIAFRHFDMSDTGTYTPNLTYYLFGKGKEAYLCHFVTIGPDFQHEVELAEVPECLTQEELEQGVLISFPALYSYPGQSLPEKSPISDGDHNVIIRGKEGLHTIKVKRTIHFDTTLINMPPDND